ncbi:MAG: putative iron-regulated protein [Oleiphilaceae bacterium]|jgi:uncharacterized iron-regulated protein
MIKLSTTILLLIICVALSACDTKVKTPKNERITSTTTFTPDANIKQRANLVFFLAAAEKAFKQLVKSGAALQLATETFTQAPSSESLKEAQKALLNTHRQYMLVQVFQKINILHPVFDLTQNQPTVIHPINIRLDQHPIITGYLDAVPNYPASGLIFTEQTISPEYLNNEHQFSDTAYVAIGFHALEFMLTGGLNQTPKERSLEFSGLSNASEKSTVLYRRSRYVELLTSLINEDLRKLSAAWTANEGFYPQALNELLPNESDRLIEQAYKIEEHAILPIKEHEKDSHPDAFDERKAQLALLLKNKNSEQD